jgi:hypothetical protein
MGAADLMVTPSLSWQKKGMDTDSPDLSGIGACPAIGAEQADVPCSVISFLKG